MFRVTISKSTFFLKHCLTQYFDKNALKPKHNYNHLFKQSIRDISMKQVHSSSNALIKKKLKMKAIMLNDGFCATNHN